MPDTPDLTHSSRDDLIHRIELLNADLAAERAHIDALTAAVEGVIFDLPIGDDVTYSRGYSAGVAASRAVVLAILRGEQ
jgi:hypothetical protein